MTGRRFYWSFLDKAKEINLARASGHYSDDERRNRAIQFVSIDHQLWPWAIATIDGSCRPNSSLQYYHLDGQLLWSPVQFVEWPQSTSQWTNLLHRYCVLIYDLHRLGLLGWYNAADMVICAATAPVPSCQVRSIASTHRQAESSSWPLILTDQTALRLVETAWLLICMYEWPATESSLQLICTLIEQIQVHRGVILGIIRLHLQRCKFSWVLTW